MVVYDRRRMHDGAPSFSQRTSSGEGYAMVSLAGEFDLSVKPALDAEIRCVLDSAELTALILDLRGLSFIDSSGIHTLVLAHRQCAAQGRRLIVLRGGPQVMRILALCGLDVRLILHDDLEQALSTVRGSSAESASGSAAGPGSGGEPERGIAV